MRNCYIVKSRTTIWGLLACLCLFITLQNTAKGKNRKQFFKLLTDYQDTTKVKKGKDSAIVKDTVLKIRHDTGTSSLDTTRLGDSLKQRIDTLTISKDSLDAPVNYTAEDSGVLIIPSKQFILYGKATTDYKDMKLEANTISYDQQTNLITAYGGTDTSHDPLNLPKMTQAGSSSISDTIRFNMKTQRGLVKNTYYQEGEMFVQAKILKKVNKDVAFGYRTKFTTCNLDTPHFAFRTRKVKIINNRFAVSGPAFPEFEGVPLPVGIPFGIYPLYRGRHSGLLPPQFTASEDFGLGLEGLGYYKVINDYWDITTRSNIYTYGGWSLNINPKYYKRYKYNGALTLAIQRTKLLNRTASVNVVDEFTTNQSFNITWSHSMDNRARPGTSFSASVNAGSTKYNTYVTNNVTRNFQNQMSSSITYGKIWGDGKYNLTVSANHNQNNSLGLVNLNVPTVNFTANTFYPFQKKEQVGTPKWYEKLGIQYTGTTLTQISFYDSAFSLRKLLDTAQWGAEHNIPISLTLPALGPILLSPSVSYAQRWYGQKIIRQWRTNGKKDTLMTNYDRGFFTANEVSFGMSANTRIFGTYNLGSTKLRHEVKPFISANYKPDLVKQYYDSVQVDSAGHKRLLSQFEGGVIGAFSQGRFGGFNFGIDNLFEMKVRDKKDTTGENGGYKKVRLIDGLGITGGYNFFADSLKWSTMSVTFRSTLFNNINITGSTSIDPYDVDSLGNRINKLLWKKGSIGRITSGNLAISTSLKSKSKDGKDDKQRLDEQQDETLTPEEQQRSLDYVRQNPAEFVDFDIPWNVQLSFALSFSRSLSRDFTKYVTQVNSNVSINGDFSLTEKWKIGGNTYFDFKTRKVQTLTMFITREMHCWQMAINVTPIGPYRSFNFTINPKSGILRDLKINRSRFYYNQ